MTTNNPTSAPTHVSSAPLKRGLLLQKLSELPDPRGPFMEAPDRKPLPTKLSHINTVILHHELQPVFLEAADTPGLEAKDRVALIDMAHALSASPSLLNGWTSVKVDSPEGALTLRRGRFGAWWFWLRKLAPIGDSSYLSYQGSALAVSFSGNCRCVPRVEIPVVVQATKEIVLCPGARINGVAYE